MTYCFEFTAPPDGIAVISDTRISTDTKYFDDQQKVFFPDEKSFITVSGTVGKLAILLRDISPIISACPIKNRIDFLSRELRSRYATMFDSGQLALEEIEFHGMSIIYGDIRYARKSTRTRLVRFTFTLNDGLPSIEFASASRFGWLAIGLPPVIRKFISNTAEDRLADLEDLGLIVRKIPYQRNPFPGRAPYMEMAYHSSVSQHLPPTMYHLDSSGKRDGTFRATLRKLYSEQKKLGKNVSAIDPIQVFGQAAMQRIVNLVEELKHARPSGDSPLSEIHSVSDAWCLASISRDGVKLCTYKDRDCVLSNFTDQLRELKL